MKKVLNLVIAISLLSIAPAFAGSDTDCVATILKTNALIHDSLKTKSAQETWNHFVEISKISRNSGDEAAIRDFFKREAKAAGLEFARDDYGNFVIRIPGVGETYGIQGHADMVFAARDPNDPSKIFTPDELRAHFEKGVQRFELSDDGYVQSFEQRNTIGADNGVSLAYMLKLIRNPASRPTRPLELIVTVREETGLEGAGAFQVPLVAKKIINLDGESFGVVSNGAMGAERVEFKSAVSARRATLKATEVPLRISLTGLLGGHGGLAIHHGVNDGVRMMGEAIALLKNRFGSELKFLSLNGGSDGDYTKIAEDFSMIVVVDKKHHQALNSLLQQWAQGKENEERKALGQNQDLEKAIIKMKYAINVESGKLANSSGSYSYIDDTEVANIRDFFAGLKVGVVERDPHFANGNSVTANLGFFLFNPSDDGFNFKAGLMSRGFLESNMDQYTDTMIDYFKHSLGWSDLDSKKFARFPIWVPQSDSPLLAKFLEVAGSKGHDYKVRSVPAGLEASQFLKIAPFDIISYGPNLENPHTPRERFQLSSFDSFVELTDELIK